MVCLLVFEWNTPRNACMDGWDGCCCGVSWIVVVRQRRQCTCVQQVSHVDTHAAQQQTEKGVPPSQFQSRTHGDLVKHEEDLVEFVLPGLLFGGVSKGFGTK